MSGFSIDDVRDTFATDISTFLNKVEELGKRLLATPQLQPLEATAPRFASVADCFHTVYGTSSLVDAKSLSETAKRLELLSEAGESALSRIEQERQRAQRSSMRA
ncbi:MAG: hypothetical protein QM756_08940 [Polyangiaceae bacterium]